MKAKQVKIDVNSKQFKYYEARKTGKDKKSSALTAGYPPSVANIPQQIEKSQQYQAIEAHFKDEILAKITVSEVVDALVDNIQQKTMKVIDRGSRNKAIEILMNKVEPNDSVEDSEQVVIILKN